MCVWDAYMHVERMNNNKRLALLHGIDAYGARVTTSSNLHGESLLWHNSGNKFEFSIYVCAYFNLFLIPWSLLSLFSSTNIKNSYKLDRLENQEHPPPQTQSQSNSSNSL